MTMQKKDDVPRSMLACRQGKVITFFLRYRRPQRRMARMDFTIPLLFARRAPTKLRLRYRQTPIALANRGDGDVKICCSGDWLGIFLIAFSGAVQLRHYCEITNVMI